MRVALRRGVKLGCATTRSLHERRDSLHVLAARARVRHTYAVNPRRVQWLLVAAFWTAFALLTAFQVWISMIHHGHSVPRLIAYYLAIWEAWLLITWFVVVCVRRWPVIPPVRKNILTHLLLACAVGVVHMSYWMVLTVTIRPFDRMTVTAARLDVPEALMSRLLLEVTLYCLVAGAAQAADYYAKYRRHAVEAAQLEASLTNARLHALELQIQPHFLFNTLNALSALVRAGRRAEAVTMISGLSELFRYTLEHADEQCVTLAEESAMLEKYLEIQTARFADRLSYSIDVAPEVRSARIPTFILQPLAENAIRHGIARSAAAGRVAVTARRDDANVRIEVFNTGSLEESPRTGIGLRNTIERLRNLYGDAERFSLRDIGTGVVATLSIPLQESA